MSIPLRRNRTLTVCNWLSNNEFVGQISSPYGLEAAYGWSKGGSFFVYSVSQGHIQKLGTVKREALDIPLLP